MDAVTEKPTLHDRTLRGVEQVIDRAMNHVQGMERAIVRRAVQALYPRVRQRLLAAAETDLREELEFLHTLIGDILQDSPATPKPVRRRGRRGARRGRAGAKTR
ncbi:MAG: hypothetical protein K6T78_03190 [Alicyclobacillus sp.]|nr:hypothetical protein [Alicyclobacillus sp.]